MIRPQDMDLALHRASVGTSAEDDPGLEQLRFVMPGGSFRPFIGSSAAATRDGRRGAKGSAEPPGQRKTQDGGSGTGKIAAVPEVRFDDLLIGVPAQLHYAVTWPLDLFLTRKDLDAYSRLFAYLAALRKTHARVLECWMTLSKAQRSRRRFTGLGEGGVNKDEERQRGRLLRASWGVTRDMLWFLDTLLGHFQVRIP